MHTVSHGRLLEPVEVSHALWRQVWGKLLPEPSAKDPLAEALASGLQCLQIAEAYVKEGADHPDLALRQTLPPYRWPDGYANRIK